MAKKKAAKKKTAKKRAVMGSDEEAACAEAQEEGQGIEGDPKEEIPLRRRR